MSDTTVVLVEDDEPSRTMLGRRLTNAGYRVVAFDRGQGVVAHVVSSPPLAVLLDADLPDVDGLTIAAELKANHATWTVPLIALSGHDGPDFEARLWEAGFDANHPKPVDFGRLLAVLEGFVGD